MPDDNMTVRELIRWRAKQLAAAKKPSTAEAVEESLSREGFPDSEVPLRMVNAIRKFRKLRRSSRLTKVRVTLTGPKPVVDHPTISAEQHLFDTLQRTLLVGSSATKEIVTAIERLIDERLGRVAPPARRPNLRETTLELDPTGPFNWVFRQDVDGEARCWVRMGRRLNVLIGSVGRVSGSGLYAAYFNLHGEAHNQHVEPLPGQHSFLVAKQRVEERYAEWVRQAAG